jgi:hypothetical protein
VTDSTEQIPKLDRQAITDAGLRLARAIIPDVEFDADLLRSVSADGNDAKVEFFTPDRLHVAVYTVEWWKAANPTRHHAAVPSDMHEQSGIPAIEVEWGTARADMYGLKDIEVRSTEEAAINEAGGPYNTFVVWRRIVRIGDDVFSQNWRRLTLGRPEEVGA